MYRLHRFKQMGEVYPVASVTSLSSSNLVLNVYFPKRQHLQHSATHHKGMATNQRSPCPFPLPYGKA